MTSRRLSRRSKTAAMTAALVSGLATSHVAMAGGILLYETGTAEIGLASAGYGARAQDASSVLTNPAGMTRLDGTQFLLGVRRCTEASSSLLAPERHPDSERRMAATRSDGSPEAERTLRTACRRI